MKFQIVCHQIVDVGAYFAEKIPFLDTVMKFQNLMLAKMTFGYADQVGFLFYNIFVQHLC